MNISGWVQLQFDCKCFKFSCLIVCWKFQSMLKSVMHVESILKKSVENYKKACWNFQYVLKTVKKHVEISVCSENCKKACWKFQNSSSEVVRSRCTSRFSSTQHSEIFWIFENCMRGIFYSLKDTLLFKCSEFLILWSFWRGLHQMHIQMIESGIFQNRDQTVYA